MLKVKTQIGAILTFVPQHDSRAYLETGQAPALKANNYLFIYLFKFIYSFIYVVGGDVVVLLLFVLFYMGLGRAWGGRKRSGTDTVRP